MVLIGVIHVLLTVIESTQLRVPTWKESALPSLLHGLDNETQSLLRDVQSQATGEKVNQTVVRFGLDEKGDHVHLIAEKHPEDSVELHSKPSSGKQTS